MTQAAALLDGQLSNLGRVVLRSGGSVSMADAALHAEREYEKFKTAQKQLRHDQADRDIAAIKAAQKDLKKPGR
ncbi:hypothetical protein GGR90_001245 [Sphingopyxis italica]|uniref:Uncharacterized protein n=1 Tax=Sphingopyxis italica TaxID=1129133 RepID=A0A7X5XPU0_9SPHN|nr:hypothetical protein [Sphingopyxis italica]